MPATTITKYPGICHSCGCHVPAGAGFLQYSDYFNRRGQRRNRYRVYCADHKPGDQPQPDRGPCSDMAYEDACAAACGPGL